MQTYVTLVFSHHILQEATGFNSKDAAMAAAQAKVKAEGFDPIDFGDKPWLGNWGDDDGCGVIVAPVEVS